jgi:uncharacterized membrane protein
MFTKRDLFFLYILVVAGLLLVDVAFFVYLQPALRDGQYVFLFLGIGVLVYGARYILTKKDSKP